MSNLTEPFRDGSWWLIPVSLLIFGLAIQIGGCVIKTNKIAATRFQDCIKKHTPKECRTPRVRESRMIVQ
jgi:hypothetical protein